MSDTDSLKRAASQFSTRTPPKFATMEEERTHLRARLVAVCRVFGKLGFAEGLLGHVTVRDPEHPELLWVNPVGVSFSRITPSDLLCVDHRGQVLIGTRPVNPVGLLLHSAIHEARPEVSAVCHAHTPHGKAWASLGRLLDPISQDACVLFEQQALIREPRIALTREDAARFADAFGPCKTAIHVGHGLFSTGRTVDEAAWWFVCMERACQVQLAAEAAGRPEIWPPEAARGLARTLGSPDFGWLSFQILSDELEKSHSDGI
ncbi:MAG: class II aldolase/adducin family protein [Burkholderiales bacterium]|nr:class II aldolase/adducin family protein [Burkholderiales bacterium]